MLCIAYVDISSLPLRRCPCVRDVPPGADVTGYLRPIYLPRFAALVDELVFFGEDKRRRGPGFRVVSSGATRQVAGPKRLGRGTGVGASRSARKVR